MERSTASCRSQKSAAASVDPSQVEHIDSFESLSFDTEDGARSLVLTTIDFDSEGAAADHLGLVVGEGSGMLELPDNIGDASAFQEANDAGIGSIVVFKKGEWAVSMHTAQGAGIDPLDRISKSTSPPIGRPVNRASRRSTAPAPRRRRGRSRP